MLNYRTLSQSNYDDLVSRLIKLTESLHPQAVDIGDSRATIGYGYTFNRNNNLAVWTQSGITLSNNETLLLAQIDAAPANQKTALGLTFQKSLSSTQADALLVASIPLYEGPANSLSMPLSYERAAFVSITYNRGVTAVTSKMTEFYTAINEGNRADAWFQIRYKSLGTIDSFVDGKAKRRYVESQLFGLYDAPMSSTIDEAKMVYAMLTKNRDVILKYESRYGQPPDGRSAIRNTIALANGDSNFAAIAVVQTLEQSLTAARNAFITWLNTTLPQGSQVDASTLNPAAIYFGGDAVPVQVLDARADDARSGNSLNKNVLVGGSGKDALIGGKGDDYLIGGSGFNTYIETTGDGADKLIDSDNSGRIIINSSADQNPNTAAALFIAVSGQPGTWQSPDGIQTITNNGSWTLSFTGGSIDLGSNFASGNLGIRLMDAPVAPSTTRDIKGDLKPQNFGTDESPRYETDPQTDNLIASAQADPDKEDTLYDSTGNDHITSGGGNDNIYTTRGGDNWVEAGSERDWVRGGAGKDLIEGGASGDILEGGSGDDRLYAGSQTTIAQAIADGNTQTGSGQLGDWLAGNAGDDIEIGSTANDAIVGGAGSDLLIGGAGDDRAFGDADWSISGLGWNMLFTSSLQTEFVGVGTTLTDPAGYGNDVIYLGNGNDWGQGGRGNDVIYGDAGADVLAGGGDNDALFGGAGKDVIYGDGTQASQGDDYLDGGADNDELYGGAGSDILIGGTGNDRLEGGEGQDIYIFNKGDGTDTIIDTKADNNIIRLGEGFNASDITLRLGSLMLDFGDGDALHIEGFDRDDVYNSVAVGSLQFADGSALNTTELLARGFDLDGTAQDDVMWGTNITDRMRGFAGNDEMHGGAGDDIMDGGAGDDYLDGGDGNDTLNDSSGTNILDGGAGDDVLTGGLGDDTLIGGTGNDVIDGGAGFNKTVDGAGADRYVLRTGGMLQAEFYGAAEGTGTAYDDTLDFADAMATEVSFAQQDDSLQVFVRGAQVAALKNVFSYKLPFAGASFADGTTWDAATFALKAYGAVPAPGVVQGTASADIIRTGAGNDVIDAGAGADNIDSGAGNDVISGGQGDDTIMAGAGDDVIDVTSGSDFANGGAGNDTYIVHDGASVVIVDSAGEPNAIRFADVLTAAQITFTRVGNDLLMTAEGTNAAGVAGAGSQATIKDFASNPSGFGGWLLTTGSGTVSLSAVLPASVNPAVGSYERYQLDAQTLLAAALVPGNFWSYSNPNRNEPDHPHTVSYKPIDKTIAEAALLPGDTPALDISETILGTYVVNRTAVRYEYHTEVQQQTQYSYRDTGAYAFWGRHIYSAYDDFYTYPSGSKFQYYPTYVDIFNPVLSYVAYTTSVTVQVATPVTYYYNETVIASRTDIVVNDFTVDGTSGDDRIVFGSRSAWAGLARLKGGGGNDMLIANTDLGLGYERRAATYYGAPAAAPYIGSGVYLDGGDGQDTLVGSNDSDVLNGGADADVLAGGGGGDQYIATSGDVIADFAVGNAGQQDTVVLPVGVNVSDITVSVTDWLPSGATGHAGMKAVVLAWGVDQSVTVVLPSDYLQRGRVGEAARAPVGDEGNPNPGNRPLEFLVDKSAEYVGSIGVELIEIGGQKIDFANFLRGKGVTGLNASNADLNETLLGSAADDVLIGGGGADVLIGGDNNDILIGDKLVVAQTYSSSFVTGTLDGPGDVFIGGKGDDQGWLTRGSDTIKFNLGDGQDSYLSWETLTYPDFYGSLPDPQEVQTFARDTIVIGGGLTLANMRLETTTNYVSGSSDRDVMRDTLTASFLGVTDQIVFVQGASLNLQIQEEGSSTASRLIVGGSDYSKRELTGGAGNDLIVAGKYNELLTGGAGSDTYYISAGRGYDTIAESGQDEGTDVLKLGLGIRPYSMQLSRQGNDIYMSYETEGLPNWYGYRTTVYAGVKLLGALRDANTVERIEFADGTVWGHQELLAKLPPNVAPAPYQTIGTQLLTDGNAWEFTLPQSAFYDADGDAMTYTATLADGNPLPNWMSFNPFTHSFGGTPGTSDIGNFTIQLTAKDIFDASGSTAFDLSVEAPHGIVLEDHGTLVGTIYDDLIYSNGYYGSHFIGGAGNDTLIANRNIGTYWGYDNTFEGGLGDDAITGSYATDTYLFGLGDGHDTINDDVRIYNYGSVEFLASPDDPFFQDHLVLGGGISLQDLKVTQVDNDMMLVIGNGADSITIKNWFDGTSFAKIEQITFADGSTLSASALEQMLVVNNHAPVLALPIDAQQANEDSTWSFSVPLTTFSDADSDQLVYSATLADGVALPFWLSFDAATRTFTGTPTNDQVGNITLAVTATDPKGLTASANFVVAVNNIDDAPAVSVGLANQSASQGAAWRYSVPANTFTDVDVGDVLTLSASGPNGTALPAWLSFDVATGTFSGRPLGANVGNLAVKVTATDTAGATVSSVLNVNVISTNHAPVATGLLNQQAIETQNFTYRLPTSTFSDVDLGDSLTLQAKLASGAALPVWLSFNAATQTLSGTPPDTASGLLAITVTATDEQGATVLSSFDLDIANIINGTALDDLLTGTVANDVIYGGLGADRITGGKGNDVYYVDNALDKVIEKANEGRDTVHSTVTHTLATNVEDLVLDGIAAIDGTGNALDNRIEGNAADNKLMGGDGNDTLLGGAGDDWLRSGTGSDTLAGGTGDDLYEVDNTGDVVVENLNEGVDTIEASVTYSLSQNVENLILTGTLAIDATGNALDNTLQGNDAANVLMGGAGNDTLNGKKGLDTLIGGLGNDTYLLEDDADTVVELAGGGRDTVISQFEFTLAANVEDGMLLGSAATITGNELANVLTGNNAANTIDGGAGADVMLGGKGNDTYIVDNQADTVIENAGEGTDTVQSSVNYTLADNLEHLILTGTAEAGMGNNLNNKITGNAASNKLFGGAGNDDIDGGRGADIMFGGLGNDKYWVDSSSDLVVEAVGEGTDTVYTSVSYALADNVENLVLIGSANINAVGNAGNNRLEGNAGNNILFGGLGNDTYVFGRGSGRDIVANFDAGKPSGDMVQLGAGIVDADLNYLRAGNDLVLSIKGTSDQLTIASYFENGGRGANALEKIRFADGTSLNHAAVLSRSTVGTGASAVSDAQLLPAGVHTGNPTALFDAPAPAATKANDASITPQSVAESINTVRDRFEQGLKNLKLGTDEQGSVSRSEFAERRVLPLLWNLQDALLNLQLAKNADGRFTADVSIDSRAARDLGLGISLLGAVNGTNGRLDQVTRPAEVQQFDLAQLH
jgi:trimeric autotransporter adhesin